MIREYPREPLLSAVEEACPTQKVHPGTNRVAFDLSLALEGHPDMTVLKGIDLLADRRDRWQIEINHRDEKDILGVGQAQVTSVQSIPRHPALAVASYSMLPLAALREFGPGRTDDYPVLPKWRKDSKRASFLDIVTLLLSDVNNEASVSHFLNHNFYQNLARFADT